MSEELNNDVSGSTDANPEESGSENGSNPSPEESGGGVGAIASTLTERLGPIISPGLMDLAANGEVQLVEVALTGVLRTTMLGIESNASSWAQAGVASDAILYDLEENSDRLHWFEHMFSTPSLTRRKVGEELILTTSPSDTFVGNSQHGFSTLDLAAAGVRTGVDECATLANALAHAKDKTKHTYVDGFSRNCYSASVNDDMLSYLNAITSSFGYRACKTGRMFYYSHGNHSPSADRTFSVSENEKMLRVGNVSDQYVGATSFFKHAAKHVIPGMKYLFLYIWETGRNVQPLLYQIDGSPSAGSWDKVSIAIPIVDDGSERFPAVFNLTDKIQMHYGYDSRYTTSSDVTALRTDRALVKAMYGDSVPNRQGVMQLVDDLPVSGYSSRSGDTKQLLMYLGLPLNIQHYVIDHESEEVVTVNIGGREVSLKRINMRASMFCSKIDKTWYSSYQNNGFGMFKPRADAVRDANIKAFNELQFNALGICIDSSYSTINADIVNQTDLARRYAKARKDACKDNNWSEQPFMGEVTYGEVQKRINAQPRVNAFYSVEDVREEILDITFAKLVNVTWTRSVDAEGVATYTRSDTESEGGDEVYSISPTLLDLLVVERGDGANMVGVVWEDFTNDLGELTALKDYSSKEDEAYLSRNAYLDRVVLANQYFSASSTLHKSGYPVYRHMPSPHREVMVMRMYADYKKIGDDVLRIIKSFVSDVTVEKLLKASISK